jgi:glutaredoxin
MWGIVRALGPVWRVFEELISPAGPDLSASEQERRRNLFAGHVLYAFQISHYSTQVRRALKRLGVVLECRDILEDPKAYQELMSQGGKDQVPCLRIEAAGVAGVRWLYESDAILRYCEERLKSG